ncbi:MAG: lysophospholipase [Nannocystaceae bacterium]|nr:lysophospholipase [Nannocystaceae bacterium]
MAPRTRWLVRILVIAVALWLALVGAVWCGQERLLFQPTVLPASHRFAFGDDVHELELAVPGATLSALHLQRPGAHGVVVFLHGNGGNLEGWFANVDFWRRAGWDLFMIDYRGYGKSTGAIDSEAQLRADVRAAWDAVAPQYQGRPRVVYGRSLGTALAAGLAADVQPELTVLVSPYRSMVALAGELYPWVPSFVARYPLRTELDVPRIDGGVLVVHGEADALIPVAHGEAVAALARHGTLVRLPGVGHNDVHESAAYRDAVLAALDAARAR